MNTAILFLIFNRPETASQVFKKIRLARPPRLYVACDGPRNNHSTDIEMVRLTRDLVTKVDWPCNIKTLFRDHNLGCKKAVSSAIDWFFEKEEQGIILEDDCVPHLDFFNFCEKLLNYYKNDKRVFTITGVNFQNEKWRGEASYYFSKFNHCWGWATWKRSWSFYQGEYFLFGQNGKIHLHGLNTHLTELRENIGEIYLILFMKIRLIVGPILGWQAYGIKVD